MLSGDDDVLLLVPERALATATWTQLRRDLQGAGLPCHPRHCPAGLGTVWLSGAAPAPGADGGGAPRPVSSASGGRPSAACKGGVNGGAAAAAAAAGAAAAGAAATQQQREREREREERVRALRERQAEERTRRLEELRAHAAAAQRFREQKEEERRRRAEELRLRDAERRSQVEERKRQIWEAERDRREAILRKNQEREARIDSRRRNERSSIVFAFGSSTPRMLEPADTGGSFWGARRATSTTNVALFTAPLTRRASERELADAGKKRATSAGGLDRKPGEGDETDSPPPAIMSQSAYSASSSPAGASAAAALATTRVNRRKTDLMPTIPSPRDGGGSSPAAGGSRSARPFTRSPGLRSGEVTPTPPSRPLSALSQQSMSSVGSGVNLRPRPTAAPRRPRPVSIAVTGVSSEQMAAASNATQRHSITGDPRPPKITEKEGAKPPLPKVHSSKKPTTPAKKPILDKSKTPSVKASPRATPKATPLQSPGSEVPPSLVERADEKYETEEVRSEDHAAKSQDVPEPVAEVQEPPVEVTVAEKEPVPTVAVTASSESVEVSSEEYENESVEVAKQVAAPPAPAFVPAPAPVSNVPVTAEQVDTENEMTASFIAKTRITTEEEAKAALAERRRLAREQAEREAELERLRQEEERRREEERIRQEEEEQRRFEEEQERLAEEARRAEEERLKQAILENQKREEEEKKRREEEARLKAEKEEAEKKAREEAERLRREMDERLRKEEEERIARRKRVEAIMLRTRGKGSAASSSSAKGQEEGENDEGKDDSPSEEIKSVPSDTNGSSQCAPEAQQEAEQLETVPQLQEHLTSSGNGHQPMDTSSSPSAALSPSPALAPSTNGKASSDATSDLLIDTSSAAVLKPVEASEDVQSRNNVVSTQSNGHQNGMDFNPVVGYVNVDNVKQNNVTNNLLDLAEFDAFSQSNNMNAPCQPNLTETSGDFEQILDLGLSTSGKLANEDNVNSNLVNTNGSSAPPAPIIAFQDGLVKKTDPSVADLLS